MDSIDTSTRCDDQPISGASLMGENRYLSSWVTPGNLEIQECYKRLTGGLQTDKEKIVAVWNYVKDIPYTPYVKSKTIVGGRVFSLGDTWLEPGQSLYVPRLNCMNKSTLLASLLRQELSENQVYVCLNNVSVDGIDGHAAVYVRLDDDYMMETTNPNIKSPFLKARDADIYEGVIWFNDKVISCVPNAQLREPMGICCVKWLEFYVNDHLCTEYV